MYRKYLRLKGCPRCGGDLLIDRAYDEDNESCIQCGYVHYFNTVPLEAEPPKKRRRRRKKVKQPA